jgi:hypothetical protein
MPIKIPLQISRECWLEGGLAPDFRLGEGKEEECPVI